MDTRTKIVSAEQAAQIATEARAAGRRVVLAAGSFDVLHAAHARFFTSLRDLDAVLLVVVYDDATAQPVLAAQARAQMVAALAAVGHVILCPQLELEALIARLAPDRVERAVPGERNIIGEVLERHKSSP